MLQWGFWDWLAYAGLWLVVVMNAAEEAKKKWPNTLSLIPAVNGIWTFMPVALMTGATAIFLWKAFAVPNAKFTANPPPPTIRTVYISKTVPDLAQATRISALEKQLTDAQKRAETRPTSIPKSPRAAPIAVHQSASKVQSAPQVISSEDQALLDTLRCQKEKQALHDKFTGFVSSAELWQGFLGQGKDETDTSDADEYSQWTAEVMVYLKASAPRDFSIDQFENAQGNDFMEPPSYLSKNQMALWKEWEAKKSVLQSELYSLQNERCD